MHFDDPAPEIGERLQRVSLDLRAGILHHHHAVAVVGIGQRERSLRQRVEQHFFGPDVLSERMMIIQMVVGNVAENGADERESLDAVLHEAVRTDFHKTVFASAFDHFGHHAIQPDAVGRRMGRFALFGIDAVGYGRNQSHLISQPAEQPVQQRRRRGFPVGSGYTHQFQITARMSVKGRRDAPQRNRRIRHPHIGHPTAQLFRQLFAYYRRRSETDGRLDKAMSVGLRSAHGEKQRSRLRLARVKLKIVNFYRKVSRRRKHLHARQ